MSVEDDQQKKANEQVIRPYDTKVSQNRQCLNPKVLSAAGLVKVKFDTCRVIEKSTSHDFPTCLFALELEIFSHNQSI